MTRWRVFIAASAERVLKGLPRQVQRFAMYEFPRIVREDPFVGEPLTGPLAWLRSFHFSIGGQPYRIAYSVDGPTAKILIHFVGHRSAFYERLRKKLGR